MENKNKTILIFSIFFLVGLGYYFLNVPLVKASAECDAHWDPANCLTEIPIDSNGPWYGTPPSLIFNALDQVSPDGSITLNWTSANATSCVASTNPTDSQWSGTKALSSSQTISNITADTTFSLLCSGGGGSITKTILYTSHTSSTPGGATYFPTLTFYTSAVQASSSGTSATLSWTSTNTTSCTASASPANSQWSGLKDVSGSQTISNITTSIAVSLTCSGTSGSITRGMTYTPASTASTLTFYYTSPTTVSTGSSATLIWASTNTTSCTASASPTNSQWGGSKDLSGSQTINDITTDTTFTLFCSTTEGNITKAVLVPFKKAYSSIPVAPTGPPTLTLYANPAQISPGGSADLIWASEDTTSCTASASPNNRQWSGSKNLSGSQTINDITTNTTFSLACSGVGGNTNDAALIALKSASSSVLNSVANQSQTSQLQSQINQILVQIAQLQSQLATANNQQQTPVQSTQQQTSSNSNFCYTFTKTLKYKDFGYAVGALQAILQKEGLLNIPKLTAYFGPVTQNAVIAFQEKYKDEILTPFGLINGTGNVGNATIIKLNQLYGCVTTINTPTNTASSATNQITTNPIGSTENQTTTTTPQCQILWWYDNYNKTCQQKQFCGSYMYLGLQTFIT